MELFTLLLFKQKRYKLYMKQEKFFRLLPIEGAYNIRDLGGYPTSDHKHVKWKTFIRSGDLDKLTESDLDYLTSLHIRTDIDFRSMQEEKAATDKIPSTVTQYIPLSIEAGDMTDMTHFNLNNIPGILEQAYVYIIQNAQDTYREFFRIVSEERNTPLLFHCSAGKDRTGIAAALLLGALGVDREVIMEDYMLSAEYIKGKYDAIVQAHPGFAPLTTVRKEYLEAAFQTIDTDYQGMDNYLKNQLGVDTHRLRMLYTE